ncbi:mastermind-like domain-containing protein 1 [Thamnophis elegans]|uniref:mastermind-like domain-containing protein 1 n=1 Tax=Thamnophis elegans TaxID=35005 RepID=UPI0013783867|nr:mastermind-like domain-containing protein 1 [Thamnophis elegans]
MLLVSPRVEAPRMEPHITGSVKRKVADDASPASGAMPDLLFPSESKRLCLDDVTLSMGPGSNSVSCPDMQGSPYSTNHGTPAMPGHGMLLENNHMNGSGMGSPFAVPPNAEVGQKGPLGGHYGEKGSNMHAVDQELQDLLEELTKMPDPSPNDLDLEKILGSKPEEPMGGLAHPPSAMNSSSKSSPQAPPLDNHIPSKDFSPGCNRSGGSPQVTPPSGAGYSVPSQNKAVGSPISSATPNKGQALHMSGANWHAQQLKHLASKQAPTSKPPTPNWPTISSQGLSPPYRQGSSPHHQPFSPQNVMISSMTPNGLPGSNIQSPQNPLLSSITSNSNPPGGLSPPFGPEKLSSPVLNQQPFSPPSSIMSSISTSSIKSSPNAGPSPYRPEKLSSPALHQQPFSPQSTLIANATPTSNPANMPGSLYKNMPPSQSKNMNVMLTQSSNSIQAGLGSEGPGAQDQFSFSNTKPLSHFSSEAAPPQKMPPMGSSTGQQSLMHYLQQQAATSPQSQQVNNNQFLQQQLRQLMQPPQRMPQRHVQPSPLSSQARQAFCKCKSDSSFVSLPLKSSSSWSVATIYREREREREKRMWTIARKKKEQSAESGIFLAGPGTPERGAAAGGWTTGERRGLQRGWCVLSVSFLLETARLHSKN